MEKNIPIKDLLMQVKKPIFVLKTPEGLSFKSKEIDFFSTNAQIPGTIKAFIPALPLEKLGDQDFKKRHSLKYAYVAGAMANGITSAALVKTMAQNGMLSFLGSAGLPLDQIEKNIIELKSELNDRPFGFNLIHSLADPDFEMATVELYLKHQINRISAAAFMRMTLPLVYYRIKGIHKNNTGQIIAPNNIIAKVSRVEVARQFFSPPPEKLVKVLLDTGRITEQEAQLSQFIPMAQDLTAEADSGGHTDNRPALALLPTMIALKNEYMETYNYAVPLCVGLAGGISTPQSAAAAFGMGAGYILTGSINQACVEAGICDDVKQMLCAAEQADVAMAPAADMFEIGARVQVLKRGTLFPMRAEKLYKLYQAYNRFEEIDDRTKQEIQDKFLQTTFSHAWQSTREFFIKTGNVKEIEKAEGNEKHKMALVFRSYLGLSSKWAIQGIPERKMDYQIWCGPAIGAFNQWVKNSFLQPAENREAAVIALNLLLGASICLRASMLTTQEIELPQDALFQHPLPMDDLLSYI